MLIPVSAPENLFTLLVLSRKGTKSQLHDAVDSRLSPDTPRPHSVAVIDDDHNSVDDGGHSDDNDNVNRDEVGHMPPVSSTPR